jgi:cell division protein FtsB
LRKNDELTAKNNQLEKHVKDLKEKNTQLVKSSAASKKDEAQ